MRLETITVVMNRFGKFVVQELMYNSIENVTFDTNVFGAPIPPYSDFF